MRPKNPIPVSIDIARARLVVAAVAIDFGVPEASINCPNKGASDICYARQVAMYLMNCVYGVTKTRIADVFGRHFSTVSHACMRIEAQRDDPVLDTQLVHLESFLRQISNA